MVRKDPNAALIDPKRSKREEELPRAGILIFTPQDLNLLFRCFKEKPSRSHRLFLVDVYTCMHGGTALALAGPMLGAPQAVMVLEKLIALGVREVIAIGWCGSLQPFVKIGDVVLPMGAVSEEGTSKHYPLGALEPKPSELLLAPLREGLKRGGITIHEGRVWSIDAPYRETLGKVESYQRGGILGVDMETSALLTVARFRGIELAVALAVSDDLSSLSWVHGFREPAFHSTREKLASLTLDIICNTMNTLS